MKNTFARSLVAGFALLAAAAAFADPAPQLTREQLISEQVPDIRIRDREPRQLVVKADRGTVVMAGVPFDLPVDSVTPSARLKVAVLNGARVYVEETIVLPAAFNAAPTIAFLANHPEELAQLRKAAAARPEAVRFTVSSGEKVIADVPFVEADRGSLRLAAGGAVIGASHSVTVRMRDPRNATANGMIPDPDCVDDCEQQFFDCYTYCDERGPGCPWCQEQYDDCVYSCPQICVEPKDVYDVYSSWTYIGSYNNGTICISNSLAYILWEDVDRRYRYERTLHCDNSYTDVYDGTEYRSSFCKQYIGPGCFGNFFNPPPNC
jgi:hypothetical protein